MQYKKWWIQNLFILNYALCSMHKGHTIYYYNIFIILILSRMARWLKIICKTPNWPWLYRRGFFLNSNNHSIQYNESITTVVFMLILWLHDAAAITPHVIIIMLLHRNLQPLHLSMMKRNLSREAGGCRFRPNCIVLMALIHTLCSWLLYLYPPRMPEITCFGEGFVLMAKFHPQVVLWNASRLALFTLLLEDKGCSASVSGETGA